MLHRITLAPQQQNIEAAAGENLLQVLRRAGLAPDAPCGGNGSCGKCKVLVDGEEVLACRTVVDRDMTVALPAPVEVGVLTDGIAIQPEAPKTDGFLLSFDIGTTTVAGYLLDGKTGHELACASAQNPQAVFGADVISRIRHALDGHMDALTAAIRHCVEELTCQLCSKVGVDPVSVRRISLVGNPAMQQLYLGIVPDNLARLPFAPVLTQAKTVAAKDYLPACPNAELLIVPDISGFVGADTVAGILATGMDTAEEMTLLVDIGTNGEMVLGNRHRMVACSTAAGPALEGANIRFGMRAQAGAIDHVAPDFRCSVIGSGEAVGICGSGLVDAVAVALNAGLLNERGRIQNNDRVIMLTDKVCLTQEDIRQLQLAKGAIAAGIELMVEHLGIALQDIQKVYLAGAFGTYMQPSSACRIGLLPQALAQKIEAVGNAAGSGAKLLACSKKAMPDRVEALELAAIPGFQRRFADCMRFTSPVDYLCQAAKAIGFTEALPLNVATLQPREDVRSMCAEDKCGIYGKNWTCPPHCGTLDECSEKMQGYARGILLQTVGQLEKAIDTKGYRRTEQQHLEQFTTFCDAVRKAYPYALCLGSGGCRICQKCAWPEPCRFPEKACSSMEAYCLFVTQVCRDNGLPYHHGERTVTYTACVLF